MEVVVDGRHPRFELLVEVARQVAHFLTTDRHQRAIDRHPAVPVALHNLLECSGQRQERLARTGHAHDGHGRHVGVEQEVERKDLLHVLGLDTERPWMPVDAGHHRLRGGLDDTRQCRLGTGLQDCVLIDERTGTRKGDLVVLEERVDRRAVDTDLDDAGVELLDGHRVGPIVLHRDAHLRAFDPQCRVLRDEHRVAAIVGHVQAGRQDPMIGRLRIEHLRKAR